jgi:hypothetical protein
MAAVLSKLGVNGLSEAVGVLGDDLPEVSR